MLFKFVTVAAAFASIVSGSAVNLETRQVGGLATCQIRTTPSNTPNGGSLSEEFILRKYTFVLTWGNLTWLTALQTSVQPRVLQRPSPRQRHRRTCFLLYPFPGCIDGIKTYPSLFIDRLHLVHRPQRRCLYRHQDHWSHHLDG